MIDAVAPHKALAARLSQIDVTDPETRSCFSTMTRRSCISGRTVSSSGCKTYLELAPALRERVADMDYVDLRFGDRVYVRAAGGKTPQEVPASAQGTSGRRDF